MPALPEAISAPRIDWCIEWGVSRGDEVVSSGVFESQVGPAMHRDQRMETSTQLTFDDGEVTTPRADRRLYLEGHCTRSSGNRIFLMPVVQLDVRKPAPIDDESRTTNVVHILLGTSLPLHRAPMSSRIKTGNGVERSVKWPQCPYCRATTVYCTGCGHVFCATRVHEVSGWTHDEEKHTVEFCHLCQYTTTSKG